MTLPIARRQFFRTAGMGALAGAGLALSGKSQETPPANPSAQNPRLLIGCAAYSFLKLLDPGKMTMEDFILKCVEMGALGADMTAYWFKSTEPDYVLSLRHLAFKNGVPFTGTGSGADLLTGDAAKRQELVNEMKKWVDITETLGAPHMRVFAGRLPKGATTQQGLDWTVEAMKPLVDYASKKGVVLGVETHGGITQRADTTLELIHRIDSPYLGITLDITHFLGDSDEDKYKQIETCIPYATQTHIRDHFDNRNPLDLDRVWQMFAKHGYRGYMTLEYQGREDPLTAAPLMIERMKALSKKYSSV
jgi:sugar phosphate isomerase/epimerase